MTRYRRLALGLGLCLALAACKTEIYTNLTEREANQMLSALLADGIVANKVMVEDGVFSVAVENDEIRRALSILEMKGLPRGSRESIGEVFAKSGIVSSPFEERVRYIYALGEEVSRTIEEIDGVLVARVHLVMPEAAELGQETVPSSAAVFVKQMPGFDLDFLMPQVRRLVANSVEGLNYDDVTVILVDSQDAVATEAPEEPQLVEPLPGLHLDPVDLGMFWRGMAAVGVVLMALLGVSVFLGLRLNTTRRKLRAVETAEME